MARDAEAAHLRVAYFARLIWQESHFDANAVSRAGADEATTLCASFTKAGGARLVVSN